VGRVLIVEDNPLFARSIRRAVEELRPAAIARSVAEALELLGAETWAAAIMDVMLPDGSGFDVLTAARRVSPQLPVLLISGSPEFELVNRAQALRAQFVFKPVELDNVRVFLHDALGVPTTPRERVEQALDELASMHRLSPRETTVVRLASRGMSFAEIARELGVTENTVKTLGRRARAKAGFGRMDDLVGAAVNRALAREDP